MSGVLVTGAGGYIGRYVVSSLLDMGYEVIAAARRPDGIDPRARLIVRDIFTDDEDLYRTMGAPEIVVHMAWKDGFVHNSPEHLQNLPLHYHFLREMLESGAKRSVVMGTMHEIGYYEGAIDENTPPKPLSLYGVAKNALRQACGIMLNDYPGAELLWLRAYYIYGDDERNHSVFTKIKEADRRGDASFPLNSGKNKYDFIRVDELGRQIAAASVQNRITGIINCCTGRPIPLRDMVEEYIRTEKLAIRPVYGAFPDRPYDSPAVWGDSTKISDIMSRLDRG